MTSYIHSHRLATVDQHNNTIMLGNLTLGDDTFVDNGNGIYTLAATYIGENRSVKVSSLRKSAKAAPDKTPLIIHGTTLTLVDNRLTGGSVWDYLDISLSINQSIHSDRGFSSDRATHVANILSQARLLALFSGAR